MTRNIGIERLCSRNQCLVCQTPGGSKGGCRDQSVCYMICCLRPPCSNELDLERPARVPTNPSEPVGVYYGETSRSCYIRGLKHLEDYRGKLHKCSLWRHTVKHHQAQIGPEKGLHDFKMIKLRSWTKPLDRLTAEGTLIQENEEMATDNRALCMNDKEDFRQSHHTTLNFNMGSNK